MGWEGGIGNVLTKIPRTTCQSFRFLILHSPPDSYLFPQVFRSVVVGTDPAKKRKGLQYQCRLVGEGMHSATPRSRVKAGEATACLPSVSNSPYCKFKTHGKTLRECDLLSLVRLKRRLWKWGEKMCSLRVSEHPWNLCTLFYTWEGEGKKGGRRCPARFLQFFVSWNYTASVSVGRDRTKFRNHYSLRFLLSTSL